MSLSKKEILECDGTVWIFMSFHDSTPQSKVYTTEAEWLEQVELWEAYKRPYAAFKAQKASIKKSLVAKYPASDVREYDIYEGNRG